MQVRYTEFADAGIRRALPDESRQRTCYAHLAFFLRRDHGVHSYSCAAFQDRQLFVYFFGQQWRVLYEVTDNSILVWSFSDRLAAHSGAS